MLKAKTTKLELTGDLAGHWVEVREFTWGEIKAIRAADATEEESTDLPLSGLIVIANRMRDWIEELTLPKEQGSNSVQPSPEQQ